ncbi:hypothetical protein Pla175_45220 [Pirellulimonas nuda]|uniref:Uncharacterized protein n=1 Tax=Pirellulimonas nuda TaxID=2528009 RepID=A0A518DI05_9BACT|nr:hypothetical protein [Pirellulimonas nuda]QDU91104.1 hypothetical protein Pla175_45220 [Pirellulimonas nuda]
MKRVASKQPAARRSGVTLVELAASGVMLAVLLVLATRLVLAVDRQARLAERRTQASAVLQNLMEEATTRWQAASPEAVARLAAESSAPASLPDGALSAAVDEQDDPLPSRRVTLTLRWRDFPGAEPTQAALSGWVFRGEEAP